MITENMKNKCETYIKMLLHYHVGIKTKKICDKTDKSDFEFLSGNFTNVREKNC